MIEDFKRIPSDIEMVVYLYIKHKYKNIDYVISEDQLSTVISSIKHNDHNRSKEYNDYLLNIINNLDNIGDGSEEEIKTKSDILYFYIRTLIASKRYVPYIIIDSSALISKEMIENVLEKLMHDRVIIKATDWCGELSMYVFYNPQIN